MFHVFNKYKSKMKLDNSPNRVQIFPTIVKIWDSRIYKKYLLEVSWDLFLYLLKYFRNK